MPLFEGEILLPPGLKPFRDATVRVRLLDVSRADAPSRVVAEVVLPGVSHEGGAARTIPFRLSAESLDARAHYILGAHVDLQGTGRTEPGDLVTVQSYPVSSAGSPGRVAMRVEEVR